MSKFLHKVTVCLVFARCLGLFLNKEIIICGVPVTLCIMMAALSGSVRLCCEVVRSCLRGCRQAWKVGQLIR